VEDEG
ncbi:hypothetical protein MK338_01380, partial [Streptococcus vestibularis]